MLHSVPRTRASYTFYWWWWQWKWWSSLVQKIFCLLLLFSLTWQLSIMSQTSVSFSVAFNILIPTFWERRLCWWGTKVGTIKVLSMEIIWMIPIDHCVRILKEDFFFMEMLEHKDCSGKGKYICYFLIHYFSVYLVCIWWTCQCFVASGWICPLFLVKSWTMKLSTFVVSMLDGITLHQATQVWVDKLGFESPWYHL